MKRVNIDLEEIACYDNLMLAAYQAARGKTTRPEVRTFLRASDQNLAEIRNSLLHGQQVFRNYRQFVIHDPKKRLITAACFRDRVIHHAIVNLIGPVLDRAMVPAAYASRRGKGTLAAVRYAQSCIRRYPWYVKIDIRKYFDSIDHKLLYDKLSAKFKGKPFLSLLQQILSGYCTVAGKGLPIGTLTSQYFANWFLDSADRFLLEQLQPAAYVRYMDDFCWWCHDKQTAKRTLQSAVAFLAESCGLEVKANRQINRSLHGITFGGYRIFPCCLRLTRRRKKRYLLLKNSWERLYLTRRITAVKLQNAYDAVYAIIMHADSREWRKQVHTGSLVPEV